MAKAITPFETEDYSLPAYDGISSLFVRHYHRGTPKIHFLIVHGALEHSGRHTDLVKFWLKSYPDVAVTVFDHIGHGRSGGTTAYVENFQHYVEDFYKVAEFARSKLPETTKSYICAHSLGGLITLTRLLDSAYSWDLPLQGVIFSSPCIRPQTIMEAVSMPVLRKLDKLTPKLHLPRIYNGADMTRDSERANDFDTDALIPRFMSVRMAHEVVEASNNIRGLSYYLKIPSLFLIAGSDKIVDPEVTTLFAHGIDKQLVEVIQYPKHHHELWNEIDRQKIFETMKKWVDKQLKETR